MVGISVKITKAVYTSHYGMKDGPEEQLVLGEVTQGFCLCLNNDQCLSPSSIHKIFDKRNIFIDFNGQFVHI